MIPSKTIPTSVLFESLGIITGKRDRYLEPELKLIGEFLYTNFNYKPTTTKYEVSQLLLNFRKEYCRKGRKSDVLDRLLDFYKHTYRKLLKTRKI